MAIQAGQWVCFNHDNADHDALVVDIKGDGDRPVLDVVTVESGLAIVHSDVPHYSGRLVTSVETRTIKTKKGERSITEPVTRRQAGDFWRD
jgi:hypothetical protein